MNFIVDAQLPRRIAVWLREDGHDAIHTLELPDANRTTDAAIVELATVENRIVITKDSDFVDTHLLQNRPRKLLLVATGNISNRDLETVLKANVLAIVDAFASADFVEIGRAGVMIHG